MVVNLGGSIRRINQESWRSNDPLISTVNVVPDFKPTVSGIPPTTPGKKSMTGVIVGVAVSGGVVSLLLIFAVLYLRRKIPDKDDNEGNNLHLDWHTRFNILLGTARGLAYLHEESRPRIVHRDVKASNILLDADLSPKVSDFGLAKLYDDEKTHISTRVAGTIGYLAPEYAMRGHLTEKADVFGFGVVILETLSGRPNTDNDLDAGEIYLLDWAWTLHEKNERLGLVDPRLTDFDEEEANRLIRAAFLCTQASPLMRPSLSRVVAMLAGDIEVGNVMAKPSYLTDWDFKDVTGSFLIDGDTPSTEMTHPNNQSTSITIGANTGIDLMQSPVNPNLSLLIGIIREGRNSEAEEEIFTRVNSRSGGFSPFKL